MTDVRFSEKQTLMPLFISQLHAFLRDLNKTENSLSLLKRELVPFINSLIDRLLENAERTPAV